MKYVIAHPEKYGVHNAVKVADTNVGAGEGFYTYPLYALGFLEKEEKQQILPEVDYGELNVPEGADKTAQN